MAPQMDGPTFGRDTSYGPGSQVPQTEYQAGYHTFDPVQLKSVPSNGGFFDTTRQSQLSPQRDGNRHPAAYAPVTRHQVKSLEAQVDSLRTSAFFPGATYHSSPEKKAQNAAFSANGRPYVEPLRLPDRPLSPESKSPASSYLAPSDFRRPWVAGHDDRRTVRGHAVRSTLASQQSSNTSLLSGTSWLDKTSAPSHPHQKTRENFPGSTAPWGSSKYSNGLSAESNTASSWSRHGEPSLGPEYLQRESLYRRSQSPDRSSAEGPKSSLQALLQSAAQTYWAHSYSDAPPSSTNQSQSLHNHRSTASFSRPSIALDTIEAEAVLEVALDQKRKQLHGMLGSPIGGDSKAPWKPRKAVEVFTRSPSEGGRKAPQNRGGEAKLDTFLENGLEHRLEGDATESMASERQMSEARETESVLKEGTDNISSVSFTENARRALDVDPSSIELRLSRIGEMLDISSLPISSRAAAQRHSQRLSSVEPWKQAGIPGKGQVDTSAQDRSAEVAAVFEPAIVVHSADVSEASIRESDDRGLKQTDADDSVAARTLASQRSSATEEFFSVPPTPSGEWPQSGVAKPSGPSSILTESENARCNSLQPHTGVERSESHHLEGATTVNQQQSGEGRGFVMKSEGELSDFLEANERPTGFEEARLGRPEAFRTVTDGSRLWAPNPRPRRKSEAAVLQSDFLSDSKSTGPQKKEVLSGRQMPEGRGRRGQMVDKEREEPYSSDERRRRVASSSLVHKDRRPAQSPPLRKITKSPKASQKRNRAKPIQLMSALKHPKMSENELVDSQKVQETPATPEFITETSRPRKSAVRNLQGSFDSVAGMPRGNIPEVSSDVSLVSVALDEDPVEDSPGASVSSEGELQRVGQENLAAEASSVGRNENDEFTQEKIFDSARSPAESSEVSEIEPEASRQASGSIVGPEDSSERSTAADTREARDLLRQLAAEKEARRAAESRAQAAEENAKVLASSLASSVAERAAIEHQLEEEHHRKASQQSALKSWADVERVQKERQVRQLTSERDELRSHVASMEALVHEGQQFAAEVHRRRAQVQEREDEIQGLKQKARQLESSLKQEQEESTKLRERVGSLEAQNGELTSAHERLRFEILGLRKGHVSPGRELATISEGGSSGQETSAVQKAEIGRLRELLNDVAREIGGSGLIEDADDQSEELTPGRFGGLSKMWGGRGKNESEGLKERNAKFVQVLSSVLEKLTLLSAGSENVKRNSVDQEIEGSSPPMQVSLWKHVDGEATTGLAANRGEAGCQTDELTCHEDRALEHVELLTWQKEKLSALEEQLRGHVQTIELLRKENTEGALHAAKMESVVGDLTAKLEESKIRLEKATHEREGLQEGTSGALELGSGESSEVGGSLQSIPRPPTLSPISPALSQLSVVGVTPKWELDENDNSFLNQYANPIFEREAEEKEVQEARAQVDELVKEKVRLETDLQAALRAAESSEERYAAAMKRVEHLKLERIMAAGPETALKQRSAKSEGGSMEHLEKGVDESISNLQVLEMQDAALKVIITETDKGEATLRKDDAANESRRLEEELQAVVAKWESEAQRMAALEAEGQKREKQLREEEARASTLQQQLADAQTKVQKAEASAAEAVQSASAAKRRLDDKESEVRALTEAAGELRRICTEQEDVIEGLRKECDDVIRGHDKEREAVRADHENELETERREKDTLTQEVGRLLGSLKNGSSAVSLKKDDLLNLREMRGKLEAAEKRVAELEALLEEAKKKDGLLGLVQKAHATIRKDMGDADKAMQEMRTRYKEMEERLAANLKGARDKEAEARAEADKLSGEAQKLRADVAALQTALAEKEKALQEARKALEKEVGTGSKVAEVTVTSCNDEEVRAAQEQVEMQERAAREAARRVDAAERKAEEKEQALAELQRGLAETLEAASEARGRADALQATLSERERALKSLRNELQEAKETWQAREEGSASAQKEVVDLKRALGDHKAQVKELVAINEELLAFGQNKEREVESLHKRIKHLEAQERGAQERFEGLELLIAQLQEEARAQAVSYEALLHKLAASEQETERQKAQNQEVMAELERVKEEEADLRAAMQNQNTDLEQARSALRAIEGSEASAISQMADLKERLAERDRRVSELLEKVKVFKEEVRLMVDDLDTCRKQVDLAREDARRQEKEKLVLRDRAAQLEEDVLEREGQISILRGSLNQDAEFNLDTPKRW